LFGYEFVLSSLLSLVFIFSDEDSGSESKGNEPKPRVKKRVDFFAVFPKKDENLSPRVLELLQVGASRW
jgi:hypothetical protein